jgi:hypothetical protein
MRHTDISTDREARLQWVLERAISYVNSAELKLSAAGEISRTLPRTSPELTWKLLLVQVAEQARSLERAMQLLKNAREDVVSLRS